MTDTPTGLQLRRRTAVAPATTSFSLDVNSPDAPILTFGHGQESLLAPLCNLDYNRSTQEQPTSSQRRAQTTCCGRPWQS